MSFGGVFALVCVFSLLAFIVGAWTTMGQGLVTPEPEPEKEYPKFHYKQKIRVIGGFWKGIEGRVEEPSRVNGDEYMIRWIENRSTVFKYVHAKHMEAIDD